MKNVTLMGILFSIAITGCGQSSSTSNVQGTNVGTSSPTFGTAQYNINKYPLNKVVCDPFGNPVDVADQQGVKAELYYRGLGQARYYTVGEYFTQTTKSNQNLFFSDINVPTRMFSEGFATKTSEVVKNDVGEKLIEYFALKMQTDLILGENDEEGNYELAVLSDDGVVVKAKRDGVWSTLINNDGDHSTRMGCSSSIVQMKQGERFPIEVQFYQGPRYHIANVLMWRKIDVAGKDAACGKGGNEYFFDPNHGSIPLKPYKDLLARGWKVVESNNLLVPTDGQYNPCTKGTDPVISDLQVKDIGLTNAMVSWKTDIPATSQVLLTDAATGSVIMTTSDNELRMDHNYQLTGLNQNTIYKVKAVSISNDLGKAISQEIEFKTLIQSN